MNISGSTLDLRLWIADRLSPARRTGGMVLVVKIPTEARPVDAPARRLHRGGRGGRDSGAAVPLTSASTRIAAESLSRPVCAT